MTRSPNILFISVDQWPADLLGVAGHAVVETPTLDQLARLGVRYTNCYAQTPICIPSRRSMMTGLTSRGHGDRIFQPTLPMPKDAPTLAKTFVNAGYQANAIGKLHVFPQRDRIGFHDAILAEEGRSHLGGPDDYEVFLADEGHVGEQFLHGMSNNEYDWNYWHLPDRLHVTNWTTLTAARQIRRRDPLRPSFWHVSYNHPHPPLVPLKSYMDRYASTNPPPAITAGWSEAVDRLPYPVRLQHDKLAQRTPESLAQIRRAFYALCTHIDHQIRLLIGTLREEGILDDTVIMFTSDHGEMLGDHGLYGKRLMHDASSRVPLIVVDRKGRDRLSPGTCDDRLIGLHDLMPGLLDLAEIDCPAECEGISFLGSEKRSHFYGESLEGPLASRMIRDDRYKLIWYPAGNRFQLFDLQTDRSEVTDLANDPLFAPMMEHLKSELRKNLYGDDLNYVDGDELIGLDEPPFTAPANRGLSGQRGIHYPPPPPINQDKVAGTT